MRLRALALFTASIAVLAACGDDSSASSSGEGGAGGAASSSASGPSSSPSASSSSSDAGGGRPSSSSPSSSESSDSSASSSSSDGGGGGAPVARTPFVYVGDGEGVIERWMLDRDTGVLTSLGAEPVGGNPSFLAASPDATHLYAVDEAASRVMAFAIDPATGDLTEIGTRRSSEGDGPAYVSIDRSGKWALVANYGGGTVAVLPILEDGSLGDAVDVESPGDNPHLIRTDPTNGYAFVPCLGSDLVAEFFFDDDTGQLAAHANAPLPAGTGPRHLEFHPTLPVVWVIGELGDSLTTFALEDGLLMDPVTISTLPDDANGDDNACADLHVHPSGKVLFGSNRGFDSIAVFPLDGAGTPGAPTQTPVDGSWPRNFGLDDTGDVLLVANQHTDEIVAFRVDADAATLTQLATTEAGAGPAWVGVVAQAAP